MNLKLPKYKEHDFRTPPMFLTPLPDRVVVAGYAAALNCTYTHTSITHTHRHTNTYTHTLYSPDYLKEHRF